MFHPIRAGKHADICTAAELANAMLSTEHHGMLIIAKLCVMRNTLVQLTASKAARAGVLSCHALMPSMHSLLVGSALHSHINASAMLSLVFCILLNRRGVTMLRTTCRSHCIHQGMIAQA